MLGVRRTSCFEVVVSYVQKAHCWKSSRNSSSIFEKLAQAAYNDVSDVEQPSFDLDADEAVDAMVAEVLAAGGASDDIAAGTDYAKTRSLAADLKRRIAKRSSGIVRKRLKAPRTVVAQR